MEKRKINKPKRAVNLLKHGTNNNQVEPYKCKYCDKCFTRPSTCKEHDVLMQDSNFISANIVKSVLHI